MWELFLKNVNEKCECLLAAPTSWHSTSGEKPPTRLENLSHSRHSYFFFFFDFSVWEPNLSQHLYSTTVQKATCKGLSKSGIINSRLQVGIGRSMLIFVLAWAVSANVNADSPLTSATWEKCLRVSIKMPIVFGSARTHIKDADLARSHSFTDAEVFSTVILLIWLVNFAAVYA